MYQGSALSLVLAYWSVFLFGVQNYTIGSLVSDPISSCVSWMGLWLKLQAALSLSLAGPTALLWWTCTSLPWLVWCYLWKPSLSPAGPWLSTVRLCFHWMSLCWGLYCCLAHLPLGRSPTPWHQPAGWGKSWEKEKQYPGGLKLFAAQKVNLLDDISSSYHIFT